MCGITGTYGGNTKLIKNACEAIKHRGPDDSGYFINDQLNIALGHQRLSILELSSLGHQPMISQNNNVVIVFNGEIYNFIEIKLELEQDGFVFKSHSDTEVLLSLYLKYGKEMLPKLNGIFAFAILDINAETLFVARDALGVKPLYYSEEGEKFYFASEIKGLFEFNSLKKDLNQETIYRYLAFLWCPGNGTPVKSIKKLLPGEALIVKNGQIKDKWKWFQLPIFRGVIPNLNKMDAIEGTSKHLRQAVHKQMISDVPLGAFLSGGLDSSSIVAFAKELNPDIRCFTIETKGKQDSGFINDVPFAKTAAKHLNVSLEVVSVDSRKIAEDIQSMVIQLDEPLADLASLNVRYISQLARDQGIKVLLSGAGGDDIFTGYRRHRAIQLENYWNWLPTNILRLLENSSAYLNKNFSINRRISKFFSGASLNNHDRLINYFRWTSDNTIRSLCKPEFQEFITNSSINFPISDFIPAISPNISRLDQMLSIEQRFFLADHNLNYTDKMSMSSGLEVRVPFLDQDLIEFAANIPNKFKQKGKEGKWVLKKAMEPYLPKEIIYRSKTGFGVPLRRWIKDDLKELLRDLLSEESINKRGLFSAQSIQKLIFDNDNGKIDASYTLLSLLCIEIWCRAYIDN